MSRKRTFLKILFGALLGAGALALALSAFCGALLYGADGKTFTLFGCRYAAVELTGDPGYPRGSLIRLQPGSIPENTPVAVDAGGILVLSDSRLDNAAVDGKPVSIAREQILGAVDWMLPGAGYPFNWLRTTAGAVLCFGLPALCMAGGGAALILLRDKRRRADEDAPAVQPAADPFPDLDYRLGAKTPASPANVQTVVITQTRPASSAIRNQKGEVRIYASGQESVLPLSVGRRVVTLGGYQITVEIEKPGARTEDITRELPAFRRGGQADPDTREITIIRPQERNAGPSGAPEGEGR